MNELYLIGIFWLFTSCLYLYNMWVIKETRRAFIYNTSFLFGMFLFIAAFSQFLGQALPYNIGKHLFERAQILNYYINNNEEIFVMLLENDKENPILLNLGRLEDGAKNMFTGAFGKAEEEGQRLMIEQGLDDNIKAPWKIEIEPRKNEK